MTLFTSLVRSRIILAKLRTLQQKEMTCIMRKTFLALGIFMITNSSVTPISTSAHAQPGIPAYAKWGTLAMKETQSKYPHAAIIDYLHEGRESKADSTIEKFKLWLKEGDREFGVFVRIEFATNTEKVIAITFQETSR